MSGNATATKSSKEKWLRRVQSVREKGENGIGGSSTVTEYCGDSKWAFSFGREFGVREGASKVSSFEPNFVTFLEWSEGAPVPGFHGLSGEFMGCKSFLAGGV